MFKYLRLMIAGITLLLISSALYPGITAAEAKELTVSEAVALLRAFDIVRGDPSGNMRLNEKLTRAQAATLFVRVLGKGEIAYTLARNVPFSDAKEHWAAGEIALVDRLGLMRGDGNGTFRPDSDITYVEVLTVLLRILEREPLGAWRAENIKDQATPLGIVPADVDMTDPAVRGRMFWSLATAVGSVPLASGETILQKYFDNTAPELKLDRTAITTTEETATITGSAAGATAVTANGSPVKLDQAGKFSHTVRPSLGENSVKFEAADLAGNHSDQTVTVIREIAYDRIEITGSNMLKANTTTKLEVKVFDTKGNLVAPTGMKAEISGDMGVYAVEEKTLVAGNKAGAGVLTLSIGKVRKTFAFTVTKPSDQASGLKIAVINNGVDPVEGRELTVKVNVVDAQGKALTDDYWRTVTLTSAGAGVAIPAPLLQTEAGTATFKVTPVTPGPVTLTAQSAGLTADAKSLTVVTAVRVVLGAPVKQNLPPDGLSYTTIRAELEDEAGKPVQNTTGQDIRVYVWTDGYGQLTDSILTIRPGATNSSGDDAKFTAGVNAGTAYIQGRVESSKTYTIVPMSQSVTGKLSAAKLQLSAATGRKAPGQEVEVTLKVLNAAGTEVTTGSYAFQIDVETSNGEAKIGGLPEGLELGFAGYGYYPVDDGYSASDGRNNPRSVVGRTYQGKAKLYLRYPRSGVVTLEPVLLQGENTAYNPDTGPGAAATTVGLNFSPLNITFAGDGTALLLTVKSPIGEGLEQGAMGLGSGTMTVRAQIVDATGTVVPPSSSKSIRLTRNSGGDDATKISGTTTTTPSASKTMGTNSTFVEWTIQSSGTGKVGDDVYTATAEDLSSDSVVLAVRSVTAAPARPAIVAIRGTKANDSSPNAGYIAPDDDFMEIQLARQTPPTNETSYWAGVKVYEKNGATPIYSGLVNLAEDPPMVRVPKAKVPAGKKTYEVSINNGVRESARSEDPGYDQATAVNIMVDTAYQITGAYFDGATGTLRLLTSGISYTGTVDPGRISIVKGNNSVILSSISSTLVPNSSNELVILESTLLKTELKPEVYYGATIKASAGWYTNADQSRVAAASDTTPLNPMVYIERAVLDAANRTLYLYGGGFAQGQSSGSLYLDRIRVGSVFLRPNAYPADTLVARTDTQMIINLSPETLQAMIATTNVMKISTTAGWISVPYNGFTYQAPAVANRDVYNRVPVVSASYDRASNTLTLLGSGFTTTIDRTKLSFRASGTSVRTLQKPFAVTAEGTGILKIVLDEEDATAFETAFGGKSVFFNADAGWTSDNQNRQAAPLPTDSVMFTVP